MTALTLSSALSSLKTRPNSLNKNPVMAFMTSGRFSVTVTTSPSRSTSSPSAPSITRPTMLFQSPSSRRPTINPCQKVPPIRQPEGPVAESSHARR